MRKRLLRVILYYYYRAFTKRGSGHTHENLKTRDTRLFSTGGLSTGSTTIVNGVPTIVYPGGCHPDNPNAAGVPGGKGLGNAYSGAVPADPSDKLSKHWKRIGD